MITEACCAEIFNNISVWSVMDAIYSFVVVLRNNDTVDLKIALHA